jgi:hypothetical protein
MPASPCARCKAVLVIKLGMRGVTDSSRLPNGSRAHQGINLAKVIKPPAWKPRTSILLLPGAIKERGTARLPQDRWIRCASRDLTSIDLIIHKKSWLLRPGLSLITYRQYLRDETCVLSTESIARYLISFWQQPLSSSQSFL